MQTNRSVVPEGKVIYYRSDGTGRDSYIRNHNGGLLTKDKIHAMQLPKPPKERKLSFAKTVYGRHPYDFGTDNHRFVHYVSDGSGRDHYVGLTEGGNSTPFRWRNQTEFKFRSSLRDHMRLPNADPEKSDVFAKTQSKFVGTNLKFHRTMSCYQSDQASRLATPKKTAIPPPIQHYTRGLFDPSIEFRKMNYARNA